MNCKTEGTQDFGSDHRLVVTILNTPMCKIARWKPRKERRKCVKKDLSSLDNPNICKEFLKNLENKFPIEQEAYSTEIAEQKIVDILNDASSCLPLMKGIKSKEIWKNDLILNQNIGYRMKYVPGSTEFKELSKQIRQRINKLRNEKLKEEAIEMNQFSQKRNLEKMFQHFKSDHNTFKPIINRDICDPAKLHKHFLNHFKDKKDKEEPAEFESPPAFINELKTNTQININTETPTSDEIKNVIIGLKNGKSSNEIPAALLRLH